MEKIKVQKITGKDFAEKLLKDIPTSNYKKEFVDETSQTFAVCNIEVKVNSDEKNELILHLGDRTWLQSTEFGMNCEFREKNTKKSIARIIFQINVENIIDKIYENADKIFISKIDDTL